MLFGVQFSRVLTIFCLNAERDKRMDFRSQSETKSFGVRSSALIVRDEMIYLAKSPEGEYYTIGGAIQFGEPTEDAVKREIKEEVGIDVKVERLAFVVENHFRLKARDFHQIEFHYLVTPLSEPNEQMEESGHCRNCEWVSLTALDSINLEPSFLKTALQDLNRPIQHFINT